MVGVGFVVELIFGLFYAWSVFVLPLEAEFGWARAETSWAFTVFFVAFPVGMLAGGRLADRWSLRRTGGLGALLLAGGLLLASFTGSIAWLVVSFGVLGGFGAGVGNNAAANVLSWFDERRGLAAGVLSMGFGLGGLLLGSLADAVITAMGWRAAFRLLAGLAFLVCFGGFQFLRKAPAGSTLAAATPPAANDHAPAEMLRAPTFWLLALWCLLVSTAGVTVFGHVVPLAVESGIAQAAAVVALGVLSLANGLGRLAYGALSDRLGLAPTMFVGALLMGAAILLTLPLTRALGQPGLVAVSLFIGSSYGGMVPLATASVLQIFGARHYGTNLGLSSFQIALSALLGPQVAGFLQSATGAYDLPLVLTGVLALGACLVAVLFGLKLAAKETATARG